LSLRSLLSVHAPVSNGPVDAGGDAGVCACGAASPTADAMINADTSRAWRTNPIIVNTVRSRE
jgi:hypothetical protein